MSVVIIGSGFKAHEKTFYVCGLRRYLLFYFYFKSVHEHFVEIYSH
jgi:hypothetical protein